MKKHFEITVYGKVQGVHYRVNTKEYADKLGIKGFVENQASGSVYIEAEASWQIIEQLLEWCKKGTIPASV